MVYDMKLHFTNIMNKIVVPRPWTSDSRRLRLSIHNRLRESAYSVDALKMAVVGMLGQANREVSVRDTT